MFWIIDFNLFNFSSDDTHDFAWFSWLETHCVNHDELPWSSLPCEIDNLQFDWFFSLMQAQLPKHKFVT